MKTRFLVRRLIQAIPKSACVCEETSHRTLVEAKLHFDYALKVARYEHYCMVEVCEIGDDDLYHPILSVKLDWF